MSILLSEGPLPGGYKQVVGIDWLTLTWPKETSMYLTIKHKPQKLLALLRDGLVSDDKMVRAGLQGYTGWRWGKWFVGWRGDGCMLVVTSHVADKWEHIPHLDLARCTRLDIKVDVYHADPRPYIIGLAYDLALKAREGRIGAPYSVKPHQPTDGPHGLEIGKRGIRLFVRIYDKWEQSKHDPCYEGVWRYEIELAKDAANEAFHTIRRSGRRRDVERAYLFAGLAERGIVLAGMVDDERVTIHHAPRPDADNDRTMGWLAKLVRPAIERLLTDVSRETILNVLGLNDGSWQQRRVHKWHVAMGKKLFSRSPARSAGKWDAMGRQVSWRTRHRLRWGRRSTRCGWRVWPGRRLTTTREKSITSHPTARKT